MSSRGGQSDGEDVLDLIGGNENQDSDHRASGDEFANDQGEGDDDQKKVVTPTVKRAKNQAPRLTTALLKGPKGAHTIEKYFQGFKFHGKDHEKEDLDRIMKRMEHWCHRLYPKFNFDDCLAKIENLGNKRDLQVFLRKYRLGEISADDDFKTPEFVNDNDDDDDDERREEATPQEEFDLLLAEQINKQRQNESATSSAFDNLLASVNPPVAAKNPEPELSDEIKERMERNRLLALERKQATLKRLKELEEAKKGNQEASGSKDTSISTDDPSTDSNRKIEAKLNGDKNEEVQTKSTEKLMTNELEEPMEATQTESIVENFGEEIDAPMEETKEPQTKSIEKISEESMTIEITESQTSVEKISEESMTIEITESQTSIEKISEESMTTEIEEEIEKTSEPISTTE